jgi:hypothetical protein
VALPLGSYPYPTVKLYSPTLKGEVLKSSTKRRNYEKKIFE